MRYHRETWLAWLALLGAATVAGLVGRRGGWGAAVLLGGSWYHTLLLPAIAVVFIRYMLIVAPWTLIALFKVVTEPREAGPSESPGFPAGSAAPRPLPR